MIHVIPLRDIIEHSCDDQTCMCNPLVELVNGDPDAAVVIHDRIGTDIDAVEDQDRNNEKWDILDYAALQN
jgi:hypothetical protein